jgi:hypothetical protein
MLTPDNDRFMDGLTAFLCAGGDPRDAASFFDEQEAMIDDMPRDAALTAARDTAAKQTRHGRPAHKDWDRQVEEIVDSALDAAWDDLFAGPDEPMFDAPTQADLNAEVAALCEEVIAFTDSVEMQMYAAVIDGKERTLLYTDGQNVQSVRHITVNAIRRCKCGSIIAMTFDLDRKQPRSYRLDRIDKAMEGHQMLGEAWFA